MAPHPWSSGEIDRSSRLCDEGLGAERSGHRIRRARDETPGDLEAEASEHDLGAGAVHRRPRGPAETSLEGHPQICSEAATTNSIDPGGRAHIEEFVGEIGRK